MNTGFLPTYVFKEGLKLKTLKELTVSLQGEQIEILEGKASQGIGHLEGFASVQGFNSGLGASTIQTAPLEKKVTWIIRAPKGSELTLTCQGGRMGKTQTTTHI